MVIDLAEDHSVDRVNLIGPDGSRYGSSMVPAGGSRVSIEILRITSAPWFHYPVGESRLVAVGSTSTSEQRIQLNPDLTLKSASQFEGEQNSPNGNLEFKVKNTGTAPTWIYRIFYEGVPNDEAEERTANKGEPTLVLKQPTSDQGAIIHPEESQAVVGHSPPFKFEDEYKCNGETVEGVATVDSPVDARARSRFKATLSGERHSLGESGFSMQYTCGEISAQLITGEDSSA